MCIQVKVTNIFSLHPKKWCTWTNCCTCLYHRIKKRCLLHFFIFFVVENKVVDVVVVDRIVCVEFPNLEIDHLYFNIILKIMVHSLCE
jgi:hypothetical protein